MDHSFGNPSAVYEDWASERLDSLAEALDGPFSWYASAAHRAKAFAKSPGQGRGFFVAGYGC